MLFGINRLIDACFLADMFIQALLGFLDRKRERWETRPRITVKRYCRRWLVIDTLSVLPYDAVVVLIPSHVKLKVTCQLDTTIAPILHCAKAKCMAVSARQHPIADYFHCTSA